MIDPLIPLVIATSLALLFFMAARHKLASLPHFQAQLAAYRILPAKLTAPAARSLPWLEMLLVFALLIPVSRAPAGLAAGLLLLVYAAGMAVNLGRGRRQIDCGCGDAPQPLSPWLLLRNVICAAGALSLALPVASRPLVAADLVFVALFTAAFALSYLMFEHLTRNYSLITAQE